MLKTIREDHVLSLNDFTVSNWIVTVDEQHERQLKSTSKAIIYSVPLSFLHGIFSNKGLPTAWLHVWFSCFFLIILYTIITRSNFKLVTLDYLYYFFFCQLFLHEMPIFKFIRGNTWRERSTIVWRILSNSSEEVVDIFLCLKCSRTQTVTVRAR